MMGMSSRSPTEGKSQVKLPNDLPVSPDAVLISVTGGGASDEEDRASRKQPGQYSAGPLQSTDGQSLTGEYGGLGVLIANASVTPSTHVCCVHDAVSIRPPRPSPVVNLDGRQAAHQQGNTVLPPAAPMKKMMSSGLDHAQSSMFAELCLPAAGIGFSSSDERRRVLDTNVSINGAANSSNVGQLSSSTAVVKAEDGSSSAARVPSARPGSASFAKLSEQQSEDMDEMLMAAYQR